VIPRHQVLWDTVPMMVVGGVVRALAFLLTLKTMELTSYMVAQTLSQSTILVTGLYGWLLFGEIDVSRSYWPVGYFFAAAATLVAGAVIVAEYATSS
jgi:drug/metabolite transporter (DMT)-like permease